MAGNDVLAPLANQVMIAGCLVEKKALRYTPARVPVSEGRLRHSSEVMEAGIVRKVEAEIGVVALGDAAQRLQAIALDQWVCLSGFLAAKSKMSRQIALHVTTIEFLEGYQNGQTLR